MWPLPKAPTPPYLPPKLPEADIELVLFAGRLLVAAVIVCIEEHKQSGLLLASFSNPAASYTSGQQHIQDSLVWSTYSVLFTFNSFSWFLSLIWAAIHVRMSVEGKNFNKLTAGIEITPEVNGWLSISTDAGIHPTTHLLLFMPSNKDPLRAMISARGGITSWVGTPPRGLLRPHSWAACLIPGKGRQQEPDITSLRPAVHLH